jgi:hypothetical protein
MVKWYAVDSADAGAAVTRSARRTRAPASASLHRRPGRGAAAWLRTAGAWGDVKGEVFMDS